jgi:hypothetical protein
LELVENLKEWNRLSTASIVLGSQLIVAKDEIATNAVAVSAFKVQNKLKAATQKAEDYYVKKIHF